MPSALVIQPAFLGDVVLATPLVESLHAGGYTVDMLVRKGNESLLKGHPKIRATLVWDKRTSKYPNLLQIAKQVRANAYDAVINPHRYASSGMLTVASGAPHICGFRQNPLSRFYSLAVVHRIDGDQHEVDRNLSLLEDLNVPLLRQPRLYPSEADTAAARIPKAPYVTVAPASVWYTKTYPAVAWSRLIANLGDSIEVHLTGAPGDRALCETIATASGRRCIVRAGELSLLQSAALMREAHMNYVNDSAPLHLASAMDAPVTAFFLSTYPSFGFGPLSVSASIRQTHHELACQPCGLVGKRACPLGHFKCSEIAPTP